MSHCQHTYHTLRTSLLILSLLFQAIIPIAPAATPAHAAPAFSITDNTCLPGPTNLYLPLINRSGPGTAPPTPSPLNLTPVSNLTAALGRTFSLQLSATGAQGPLTYSVAPLPLPPNATFAAASGRFTFHPDDTQVGSYTFTFAVTDGIASASQMVTIQVPAANPSAPTVLSGQILDANAADQNLVIPLVGATVRYLTSNLTTTTDSRGCFTFTGLPPGEHYFEYDGSTATPAGTYGAYRGQKLIIANVTNAIDRPIYIMKIDKAGETVVNPNARTLVTNPNISVTVDIPANTVLDNSGKLYDGPISVSPVPEEFTPAALPNNLDPSNVLTIQPMGLTFQRPAPIRFPNNDNLEPGSEVNIWSLDHELGRFFVAGKGRVSDDRKWINTFEGGIRESSWHFILPLLLDLLELIPDALGDNNPLCKAKTQQSSLLHLADGCLESSIQLPSYLSVGEERQLGFTYLSQRAWPVPILPFQATLPAQAAIPTVIQSSLRNFGGLTSGLAAPVVWDKTQLSESKDELLRGAVSVDATSLNTGVYPYSIRLTNQYGAASASSDLNGRYPLVNERNSPFGAGWGLAGMQRLHISSDGSALLTNGDGSAINFRSASSIVPTITSLTLFSANRAGDAVGGQIWNTQTDGVWVLGVASSESDDLPLLNNTDRSSAAFTSVSIPINGDNRFDLHGEPTFPFVTPNHHFGLNIFFDNASIPAISALSQLGSSVLRPNTSRNTFGSRGGAIVPGSGSLSYTVTTGVHVNLTDFTIPGIVKGKNRVGAWEDLGPVGSDDGIVNIRLQLSSVDKNAFLTPAGEFSTLIKNTDGTYTRRLKDGTEYRFNTAGLQTAMLDRNGNTTQYAYDSNNRLTTITDPAGLVTTLAYNGARLGTVTDPMGRVTTFEHNGAGDLVKVTLPDSSSKQFGYDNRHLMTTETDERSRTTTRAYDAYGRLVSANLPENVTRSTEYAQKIGLFIGTPGEPAPIVRPDAVKTTVTDGENRTTTYTFGPIQSIATTVDPAGLTTTINRDSDSNPTKTTYPSGQVINQSFDSRRNLLTVNDPNVQGTTSLGYEPLFNQPVTIKDPFNNVTNLAYDGKGNPIRMASPLNRTVRMAYNAAGLPTVITDTLGTVANLGYDAQGHLTQLGWGSGNTARNATFAYTSHGYLANLTDPLGRGFAYQYDALGRLTQENLPGARLVSYGYDAAGNLTSLTPPGRPAHQFEYDGLGQLTAYIPPLIPGVSNPRTSYAYNKAQQVTQITRPDGLTINYGYDSAGRLQSTNFSRGALAYSYSPTSGQLTAISAPENVNLGLQYKGDLLTGASWSGALNGTVQRAYDAGYRTASITVNGAAIAYQYDADSAPTRAGALALGYQPSSGLLANTTLGNVNDSFGYNVFGELQSYRANVGAAPLFQTSHARDSLGRITTLTETITNTTQVYVYGYDAAGRLERVTRNGAQIANYTYDANGNRLSYTDGNGTSNGSYDDQDRLLSYGNALYSYSANGELQSKTVASTGSATGYSYDEFGNLTRVTLPSGDVITYLIDGQDRRIGKRVNGVLQKGWLYEDQLRPVAELDGSGAVVSRFVYATRVNVPDYMVKGNVTYRLVLDHLGSVRLVVNTQTGQVVQRLDYDAWGVVTQDTNPGIQPFGFAGGLYDGQTGLVRFGARDYDAGVGRWTTKDPIGFEADEENLYLYSRNNPVNFLDYTGRTTLAPEIRAGIVIGGSIGGLPGAIIGGIITGLIGAGINYCIANPQACGISPNEENVDDELQQCLEGCKTCPGSWSQKECERKCWREYWDRQKGKGIS